MIEIEQGVPIPEKGKSPGRREIWPFGQMEVGDSFFAEGRTHTQMNNAITSRKQYTKWDRKFSVRTVEGGCRVWRVE